MRGKIRQTDHGRDALIGQKFAGDRPHLISSASDLHSALTLSLRLIAGAIAAYNTGEGRVESYENVDSRTTGKDYSNDVVARAQWYKQHGF